MVFDTETSGLIPKHKFGTPFPPIEEYPYIMQISWIVYNVSSNEIEDVVDEYVQIPDSAPISPESTKVNGITREMTKEKGLQIAPLLVKFFAAYMNCDCIVAHNLRFDGEMVRKEMWRNRRELEKYVHKDRVNLMCGVFTQKYNAAYHIDTFCTMMNTIQFCGIDWVPKPKLVPEDIPKLEDSKPVSEEIPKSDIPKSDIPKSDIPKLDIPKLVPKSKIPKSKIPKLVSKEVPKLVSEEVPKSDVPKLDLPKLVSEEVPKLVSDEVPKSDLPKSDVPKSDLPKSDLPKSDGFESVSKSEVSESNDLGEIGSSLNPILEPVVKPSTNRKKFPRLAELYGKLFDTPLPKEMHNSIVDVLVCLRCFLKVRGVKEMEEYVFLELVKKHTIA